MRTAMEKAIRELHLRDWSEFETAIRRDLGPRELVVRMFDLVTFDGIETGDPIEVFSLDIARRTGTDRRSTAHVWNVQGFDYEHDRQFSGKAPDEIIYAFWVDFRQIPYKASRALGNDSVTMETYDLTADLNEHNGVIVYDPANLERKSANEYWFKTTALSAALLLMIVDPDDI